MVMNVNNKTTIRNLKIGIIKDLFNNNFITGKQMEAALRHINRTNEEEACSQRHRKALEKTEKVK